MRSGVAATFSSKNARRAPRRTARRRRERVVKELGVEGEMILHTDPCHRIYCRMCDLDDCPVRREPFSGRPRLTLDEAVQPDMPRGRP